jgi:hypothetical protein
VVVRRPHADPDPAAVPVDPLDALAAHDGRASSPATAPARSSARTWASS